MKLYVMRHGQAANVDTDPQRGLSAVGRAEIENLAHRLAQQGIRIAQVLHSNKSRAQQTAEIMASAIAPGVMPQMRGGLKPNDNPRELLPEITRWQQDTLITSHLPFVPNLLEELTGQVQGMGFVPGSVVCLVKEGDAWQVEWVESP